MDVLCPTLPATDAGMTWIATLDTGSSSLFSTVDLTFSLPANRLNPHFQVARNTFQDVHVYSSLKVGLSSGTVS